MKPNCYIDFDGTIVSNKNRLYVFFIDHIPERYRECLSIEEFWQLKRLRVHEIDWLNSVMGANVDKSQYNRAKIDEIENEYYLNLDYLIDPSWNALEQIGMRYNLIMVSRRTHEDALKNELERLGVSRYLSEIIVVPHGFDKKSEYIQSRIDVNADDIMIGDTEDDIECGIELNIDTYFVLSGIRSKWIVEKMQVYKVNIINSIAEIIK